MTIIIIGAGMAGLAAGHKLHQMGHDAIILEARGRIGGRVYTHRGLLGANSLFERGAEFVHGEHAISWELIKQGDFNTYRYDVDEGHNRHDARIYRVDDAYFSGDSEFARQVEQWVDATDAHFDDLYAKGQEVPDISVAKWFEIHAPLTIAAAFAKNRLARIEAASAQQLSAKALSHEHRTSTNGWQNFRLAQGYDQLAQLLSLGLKIQLNTPVSHIRWDGEQATIHTETGAMFKASRVIITVPLSILQQNIIQFTPSLPEEKQLAILGIEMGVGSKLTLWFRRKLWTDFAFLSTDMVIPTWWQTNDPALPALTAFISGETVKFFENLSDAEAIEHGLKELSQIYGRGIRQHFMAGAYTNWQKDPWSRGAYSFTPVGVGNIRQELATTAGVLHFAGEATMCNGHHGTVHGAIESGYRAAEEVIQKLV
jgi:monoamine oxidase